MPLVYRHTQTTGCHTQPSLSSPVAAVKLYVWRGQVDCGLDQSTWSCERVADWRAALLGAAAAARQ